MADVKLTEEYILSRTKAPNLKEVKKLNCWACGINDVSILQEMTNVEILTLSTNNITTLKDIQHCLSLNELYIRGNNISDLNEIFYLKNLKNLKILWLSDNPCAVEENYRLIVLKTLPNLVKLDNTAVTAEELVEAKQFNNEIKNPTNELVNENEIDVEIQIQMSTLNEVKISEENAEPVQEDVSNFDSTDQCSLSKGTLIEEDPKLSSLQVIENIEVEYEEKQIDLKINSSDVEVKLSFEETNKLREELGFKPFKNDYEPLKLPLIETHSPNVLTAVLLLIQDLTSESLDIVMNACQTRKDCLKSAPTLC